MTKKELQQLHNLNREVEMWIKELERLKNGSLISGQVITGLPMNRCKKDRVGDLATSISDLEVFILHNLDRIQKLRREAMEYIDSIEDIVTRQIFYLRCVSGLSWGEVALTVGGGNSEEGVRKRFNRYFQNNSCCSGMSGTTVI